MEILKIQSSHGLTTTITAQRPAGAHTYHLNCSHFHTAHRDWQRNNATAERALGVMTLDFERIWITTDEVVQVAAAIQATRSPLTLNLTESKGTT